MSWTLLVLVRSNPSLTEWTRSIWHAWQWAEPLVMPTVLANQLLWAAQEQPPSRKQCMCLFSWEKAWPQCSCFSQDSCGCFGELAAADGPFGSFRRVMSRE